MRTKEARFAKIIAQLQQCENENAWAWPDTFGLGCCLAPEPTTPATPGVRFVSKGKRQRVPEDDRESGR